MKQPPGKKPQGILYDITAAGRDHIQGIDERVKMLKHIKAMENMQDKDILRVLHLSTIESISQSKTFHSSLATLTEP